MFKAWTIRRSPWLAVAAVLVVGEAILLLVSGAPTLLHLSAVGVALVLALFLLRGNRVAWLITATGGLAQLISAIAETHLVPTISSAIIVLALVTNSSRALVWDRRSVGAREVPTPTVGSGTNSIRSVGYYWLARLSGWEAQIVSPAGEPRTYGALLFRLFFLCILLLILVGATTSWHEGSGHGNAIVDILSKTIWAGYVCVQTALVVFLFLEARSYIIRRKRRVTAGVPRAGAPPGGSSR